MKVRIKILWKLQVKEIEVDEFSWDYKKRQQMISFALRIPEKARFLASFRKRDKFSVAWPNTGPDQDKYSHYFTVYSFAGRNHIITIL